MGKIGDFAYNIGTSLNQEDINTHRQTITPTEKTLQSLSTDEQLAIKQDNQALLDGNEMQRNEEVGSGDEMRDYDGDWRGKSNAQLAKETSEFMSNEEALIIKEVIGNVLTPVDVMEVYYKAETDAEKVEAIANLIPANKIASKAMRKIKAEEIVRRIKKSDAEKWNEIRAHVAPPHARHKIDQIVGKRAEIKNTVVSSRVDMNKDIELIRQGYGTPKKGSSGEMQIEINGRTYQTHAGGSSTQSNRLIPISSNKMGEIFELSRGQYVNLQEIVKHGGDIAKARAEMSRRKDFKQSDFDRAVEVYNAAK